MALGPGSSAIRWHLGQPRPVNPESRRFGSGSVRRRTTATIPYGLGGEIDGHRAGRCPDGQRVPHHPHVPCSGLIRALVRGGSVPGSTPEGSPPLLENTTPDAVSDAFFALHHGLPRQSPGSDATTRRLLALAAPLPAHPRALDLGCGPGRAALLLAGDAGAHVTAVDLHQPFLDELRSAAAAPGPGPSTSTP